MGDPPPRRNRRGRSGSVEAFWPSVPVVGAPRSESERRALAPVAVSVDGHPLVVGRGEVLAALRSEGLVSGLPVLGLAEGWDAGWLTAAGVAEARHLWPDSEALP